jgi:demethylmenaquinone methyltransferase/2-methoxy-6-polyprenyl-1,4-benzoquinol methylase
LTANLTRYERVAPLCDLLDLPLERGRYRTLRPLPFEKLAGRLLDAGTGTGRNTALPRSWRPTRWATRD